ncbi:putative U1 small nuclear ribonucleoprotein A [Blattamonas nauphoetae]|uniref:U1 small nuclear ribonucleoprotein A n=1 Tax=Blattamonas nauphoetae TaxID=2049346 RepID=A0ABQ9YK96_9EUKA|nr:putative U1 small nuclear ribonucleoprotein A [Blattamonas nauphoetae]
MTMTAPPGVPQQELSTQATFPQTQSVPRNCTIYVNNLNDHIKTDVLERALRDIYSPFGSIKQIVCMKSYSRRGQAFIVYDSIDDAAKAVEKMNQIPFQGKPMHVTFARTKSYVNLIEEGIDVEPLKKIAKKRAKHAYKERKRAEKAKRKGDRAMGIKSKPQGGPGGAISSIGLPNNKLFVQNLPEDRTQSMMDQLFSPFEGFREVRLIDGRTDIAFVDYETDDQAERALNSLQNYQISPTHSLLIVFAKK